MSKVLFLTRLSSRRGDGIVEYTEVLKCSMISAIVFFYDNVLAMNYYNRRIQKKPIAAH